MGQRDKDKDRTSDGQGFTIMDIKEEIAFKEGFLFLIVGVNNDNRRIVIFSNLKKELST